MVQDFDASLIVKNTGWLYLRSFAVCLADLIAARVVLQGLGVDGFGLYAAISGVVGIIAFLDGALEESFRRYFSVEIGKVEGGHVAGAFAASWVITVFFALLVICLGETVGLAFVRLSLAVPEGYRAVSFWAYQLCLLAVAMRILTIPYVSYTVASERMHPIAFVGVLRAFSLLMVAYAITQVGSEYRLLSYVTLVSCIEGLEFAYWRMRFRKRVSAWKKECRSGGLLKEMCTFCALSSLKPAAFVARYNGTELLLNLRSGVAFNSTWSVAVRLSGALYTLTGNFLEAFSPQLIKLWGRSDRRPFFVLHAAVVRCSFSIMWFFAFPVLLYAPEIGGWWLGENMPPQFSEFVRALTVNVVFDSLGWPLHSAIIADTRLLRYPFLASGIVASGFLLACLTIALGAVEWTAPCGLAVANAIAFAYRVWFLKRNRGLDMRMFGRRVLLPICAIVLVSVSGAVCLGRLAGVAFSGLAVAMFIRGYTAKSM